MENTTILENMSIDGKYKAIVFVRDAGATTSKSYNLYIIKSGNKLSAPVGNAFQTYSDFSVEWIGNKKLLVKVDNPSKRIIYKLEKVDDINIEYNTNEVV